MANNRDLTLGWVGSFLFGFTVWMLVVVGVPALVGWLTSWF